MNKNNTKRIYYFILFVLCFISACKKNTPTRIHFTDAVMVASTMDELPTIYLNGELYSGEIWSNDNRTICMEVRDGQVETFTLYHMNGKIANIQYGNGDGNNFDEYGNTLSETELDHSYPYLRQATDRILRQEIIPNVKQQ